MRLRLAVAALLLLATPAYAGGPKTTTAATYDVSYPQCGGRLPTAVEGGIVGVNNGIVFSANPCLASEWAWARNGTKYAPALYANTGNPGPAYSSHWPIGQTSPLYCAPTDPNSTACSYDYGWNAAKDSVATAAAVTSPAAWTWWLDVETGNSWQTLEAAYGQTAAAQANDRAALSGAVAALRDAGVTSIGFYSTSYQWGQITGGTGSTFSAYPAWVAGTGSLSTAQRNCASTSFTGGPIVLAQYAKSRYDADYHC